MAGKVFDLLCVECGVAIRLSRVTDSAVGPLPFFEDEDGMEQREFHFHQAVVELPKK